MYSWMTDDTCMSITKMIEENSDRVAPRESRVMLPGQSHISKGMTVLAERGVSGRVRVSKMSDALVWMFSCPRCGFEKEGLFRGYVVEKELLDGGLSTSARGKIEIGDRRWVRRGETDPC